MKPETELLERLQGENIFTRRISVAPKTYDEKKRSVRVVASTETPVEVFDWERWDFVNEILIAGGFRLRSGDQVPLLDSHSKWSVEDVIGSARNWSANNGQVEADMFFASDERSMTVEAKVRDGHVTDVSVGYKPLTSYFIPKDQRQVIEGKEYVGPVRVTTVWEVRELSPVPIGADRLAKARSLPEFQEIVNRMNQSPIQSTGVPVKTAEELAVETAEQKRLLEEMRGNITILTQQVNNQQEAERQNQIRALTERFTGRVANITELREEAIKNKLSPDAFKGLIVDRISDDKPIDTPDSNLGLSRKEQKQYSFVRAILNKIDPRNKADFENECTRALIERGIKGSDANSILVPFDVQMRGLEDFHKHPDYLQFFKIGRGNQRDLVTTSTASAGDLVGTNLLASSFIELLRNKMLLTSLGVRSLTGLVGNLAIPRQTGAATAVWETEGTGITSESTQTFNQLTLSPNEVGAYTEVSRKMLQQGTPAVEGLVQSDLATVLALAIDKAGFHGSGGTQPTGIVGASGVGSTVGANLDWPAVVDFETDVATANADVASMAYVTTAAIYGILKTREKASGYPMYLMNENGTMNGYRVERTNQITSGYMFFGDFLQALLAFWGVLEILVNPYILDKEGMVRITAHQSVDFGVRQAGAFSVASDVS